GSNSLAECLVFGREAGLHAATHGQKNAADKKTPDDIKKLADAENERIEALMKQNGGENAYHLTKDLQVTMEESAGIIRGEKPLREALEKIPDLRDRTKKIGLKNKQKVFNQELTAKLELDGMLNLAETVLLSAINRTESRGAHFREDYPHRDDQNFLIHQMASMQNGRINIEKQPVTITRWQPAERNY
ncbi:MAG TPA: succinate dehydrogenase/fumarate reductase flavoprotein subunit, partial [Candidatus Gracilibacteria bacterium]|nr:succinate dehydrogenase/fumarate reductase flavoprotein subunit [Candidatus Gracilibacteria bacterium]